MEKNTPLIYLLTFLEYAVTRYIKHKSAKILNISEIYRHTKFQDLTLQRIRVTPISEVSVPTTLVLPTISNWKYKVVMKDIDEHEFELYRSHLSFII